ncbi:hypothetical protein Y1Q_0002377 [Alligator mississippiensis]|uniref:Uncharacterized protein n=1 Tax=Alligator mississippiensis TaxID=8496 RepID=A0A151MGY0_ALLMI|nr:hypothetical protein Y1Q_0002377 [Alligator mississippiensis]
MKSKNNQRRKTWKLVLGSHGMYLPHHRDSGSPLPEGASSSETHKMTNPSPQKILLNCLYMFNELMST